VLTALLVGFDRRRTSARHLDSSELRVAILAFADQELGTDSWVFVAVLWRRTLTELPYLLSLCVWHRSPIVSRRSPE
jgi:hypothetical protein